MYKNPTLEEIVKEGCSIGGVEKQTRTSSSEDRMRKVGGERNKERDGERHSEEKIKALKEVIGWTVRRY